MAARKSWRRESHGAIGRLKPPSVADAALKEMSRQIRPAPLRRSGKSATYPESNFATRAIFNNIVFSFDFAAGISNAAHVSIIYMWNTIAIFAMPKKRNDHVVIIFAEKFFDCRFMVGRQKIKNNKIKVIDIKRAMNYVFCSEQPEPKSARLLI